MTAYLRYSPALEQPPADEADTIRDLVETMRGISETTLADGGHPLRSVHAKSHGLLEGELEIIPDLPPELAQGLFAAPGRFAAVLRFSTNPGDILDDSVSVPRGLAIKVRDVSGDRLEGSEEGGSQDFVLVNGPAFTAADPKSFAKNLKLLAATTDRAEPLKKAMSAAMRGVQQLLVATTGAPSPTVAGLGGQLQTHILGEHFFSQVPVRFGDYVAKVKVAPASPELVALTDTPLDLNGKPDGLREAVVDFFRDRGGVWDLQVQLCTNLETMPIEDASVVWPEAESPYRTVARIHVPAQPAWSEEASRAIDDGLSFSPWHGLAAHRPLGGVMRARKPAYEMSSRFRTEHGAIVVQS